MRSKLIWVGCAILLVFCICWKIFGWGHLDNEFCVTVDHYVGDDWTITYHQHHFPFDEDHTLKTSFDISSDLGVDDWLDYLMVSTSGGANDVVHQLVLGGKSEMITIARRIKTYDQAVEWNREAEKSYKALSSYRKLHPCHLYIKESAPEDTKSIKICQ